VAITSDKGLAGGYNVNIFRKVNELCAQVRNPVLILFGAIGYRHFINSPWIILENFSARSRPPDMDDAKEIAEYLISQYIYGVFDEIHIVYTHMYSSIKLVPRELQLLPLNEKKMQEEFRKSGGKRKTMHFEYWPSKEEVFDSLVPMYVKGVIYSCLVEAYVSEQSARMSAMDVASKNAEEMLADLRISYNRARQAGITQEMTEIVGGAEALSD
jgi:F-type H+-transporting ATPase subunit gamma